ncbi:MAG TPA: ABC transporter ATP-binding protein [Candidatus Tetragenococcus pullicola]|nr:ABC transporter ATP-binding protein [Candidatus Tetragenococcus pullicola]
MIELKSVSKQIKEKTVLNNISLSLQEGKCYLLTGHNGSGKTMLLRLIAGLMKPTEGEICYDKEYDIGVIIESPQFIKNQTVYQNLENLATIQKKISKVDIEAFLDYFNLLTVKDTPVKKLSLGMNQRLALCQAFMEDQNLILLDEPFNALDEENITQLVKLILKKKKEDKIIVIAAHNINDNVQLIFDENYEMENGSLK